MSTLVSFVLIECERAACPQERLCHLSDQLVCSRLATLIASATLAQHQQHYRVSGHDTVRKVQLYHMHTCAKAWLHVERSSSPATQQWHLVKTDSNGILCFLCCASSALLHHVTSAVAVS